MKRGFTLIELLIAVLIIGVLTAMALPMYQKSVDKSRYATLMPLAKNIKDAQEAFYLGGGKYSKDLGSLDVRVPGNPSGNTATLSDGTTVEISNTDGTGYVKMGKENLNNYYVMYQDRSGSYPGEIHCEALSDNDRANELCQNLGGTKIDNALTSGYTAYVLVGTGENAGNTTPTITKTVVSAEACTKNTWYSDCQKYVYDDGTYAERYDGEQRSAVYAADGTLLGEYSPGGYSGQTIIAVGTVDAGGYNLSDRVYGDLDGAYNIRLSALEAESPYSGTLWEGYSISSMEDNGKVIWDVKYGDSMGDGEYYSAFSDGSWRNASASNGDEGWSVMYSDGSNGFDPGITNYGTTTAPSALTDAWAAAGYRSDVAAIIARAAEEKDRIISTYCALDPDHSACQ